LQQGRAAKRATYQARNGKEGKEYPGLCHADVESLGNVESKKRVRYDWVAASPAFIFCRLSLNRVNNPRS
jgi:hypothetical protein